MNTKKEIPDTFIMPFGEFKGKAIANVPAKRLLWYYERGYLYGEVKLYVEQNIDILIKET